MQSESNQTLKLRPKWTPIKCVTLEVGRKAFRAGCRNVIDASCLGLPPGQWPEVLITEHDPEGSERLGETHVWMRADCLIVNEQVLSFTYTTQTGKVLEILND